MHPDAIIHDVEQGTDEWHAVRAGILTASEVGKIITPTLKIAKNDQTSKHVFEIAAQRINGWSEPTFIGANGDRGHADEAIAFDLYSANIAPLVRCGIITRDVGGCVIGYSPDGIGAMGGFAWECKSRLSKYQVEVIASDEVPKEHILQVQAGLLVSGLEYIDYTSYCGGMPMWQIPAYPLPEYQEAITAAAIHFENQVQDVVRAYGDKLKTRERIIETERAIYDVEGEIYVR